jgi:hypothetical protein
VKARPSAEKRRKERDRQERQQEKAARREQRKAERARRGEVESGVDPDIAHIVAGPHNRPPGASAAGDDQPAPPHGRRGDAQTPEGAEEKDG